MPEQKATPDPARDPRVHPPGDARRLSAKQLDTAIRAGDMLLVGHHIVSLTEENQRLQKQIDIDDRREQVIRLATEYMGWSVNSIAGSTWFSGHGTTRSIGPPNHGFSAECCEVWNPFDDIRAAYELEAAIPEGKREAYARHLYRIIGGVSLYRDIFNVAHATPAQRSEAALAVLEGE